MCDIDAVLDRNLTPEQKAAADDPAESVLCLACAGSGKSRTMAFRIARLLAQGADPEGIVAFTFTEKAADTIKRRVAEALRAAGEDPEMLGAMYLDTIHGFCKQTLGRIDARYRQFDVLDDNRLVLYLISHYPQLELHHLKEREDSKYFSIISEVQDAWKVANDEMADFGEIAANDPLVGRILRRLRASLDEDEFVDFSSMVRLVVEALEREEPGALEVVDPLAHLLVDEYQDVNPSEEALIRSLNEHSDSLFVVGDDDQAIHGWRGADVEHILTFGERYDDVSRHTLSKNWRSTPKIVELADDFVSSQFGPGREEKEPYADPVDGPQDIRALWFDHRDREAEWVATRIESLLGTSYREEGEDGTRGLTPADFAILMRSTKGSEQDGTSRHTRFTQALEDRNIPYTLEQGGGIFERSQPQALRATFELLRHGMPSRDTARQHFSQEVQPAFPEADFHQMTDVLTRWGREIHNPREGTRRRVRLQQFVHELLNAFGIHSTDFDETVLQDLGVFSRMIQDVETVWMSVDSARRYKNVLNFLSNSAESGYDSSVEDVLRRPDAVMVSTVHKAKGLEFPAVFLADVEHRRFPRDRSTYDGLVPPEAIPDAIDRDAYRATRDEEIRLFYTAITRAERYLHITGAERLPAGNSDRQVSPFVDALNNELIERDPDALPDGLEEEEPRRSVQDTVVPSSYSQLRYYLRCPQDYRFRHRHGFSPQISETFGYGRTVHAAVGKLHEVYNDDAPDEDDAERVAEEVFHLKHVPQSNDPENNPGPYERAKEAAADIVRRYAYDYQDDFTRTRQVEIPFEVPMENSVISGAIDLLLEYDQEGNLTDASVIDFKTLEGGDEQDRKEELDWTELALQVQLYAVAAIEVLGEPAHTGAVHLLKDGQRVEVPVDDESLDAAIDNVEWAIQRIIDGDYPMRPEPEKCAACDFQQLCPQEPEAFNAADQPSPIHLPEGETELARAFSEFSTGD